MVPILYTDSDKILSTLGLSSEDLADTFFQARDLERVLSVDLFTWIPSHSTIYLMPGSAAPTEQAQFNSDCLVLYCTYFCAFRVLDGILGIMSKESDGQNEYSRFGSLDFTKLVTTAQHQAGYYRQLLLKALSSSGVAVRVPQSTVVTPTYDPVTG